MLDFSESPFNLIFPSADSHCTVPLLHVYLLHLIMYSNLFLALQHCCIYHGGILTAAQGHISLLTSTILIFLPYIFIHLQSVRDISGIGSHLGASMSIY